MAAYSEPVCLKSDAASLDLMRDISAGPSDLAATAKSANSVTAGIPKITVKIVASKIAVAAALSLVAALCSQHETILPTRPPCGTPPLTDAVRIGLQPGSTEGFGAKGAGICNCRRINGRLRRHARSIYHLNV
jgi:hypothetical protein